MKKIFIATCLIVFLPVITACFAQDKQQPEEKYYYSLSDGDVNNPMPVLTPPEKPVNQERQRLLSLLNEARLNENIPQVKEYQAQLDKLEGYTPPSEYINDPEKTGILGTSMHYNTQWVETDAISTIGGAPYWAVATQTSHKSTAIFAAVTEYVNNDGDRISVYVSYNHGQTWIKRGEYDSFAPTVDCRSGELDIEPVINGADTLIFVVAGYTYNSNAYSYIGRFNIGTGIITSQSYSYLSSTSHNYDPRITSDNTVFGAGTFIYITVANDSALAGGNLRLRQRFCSITNPFETTFTQTHRTPNTNGGGSFFWFVSSAPAGTRIYQDIGFYQVTGSPNRIYTTVIYSNQQNIFNAWSDDYGVTNAGSLNIAESVPVKNVRIAFNGGPGNMNGALVFLRNYTGTPADVDVKCLNTGSGGTTTGSFVSSSVESTSDTATSCDIQAVKLASNKFKFAYSIKPGECYYRSNTGQASYTTPFKVNNFPAGEGYGRVRAGYRVTTDSCFAIWSTNTGGGAFSTYGCGITGIEPVSNTIPGAFTLAQNYPNPFNPSTTISFSVPERGYVSLKIYDVLGKEITALIGKELNAGTYNYDFDASALPSGIYFYKLETGKNIAFKKMTLVK
jgi:hypothetical protein